MKRIICLLLCTVLFCGCTNLPAPPKKQYTATFVTLFDTITTIVGKAYSENEFKQKVQPIYDELERYHKLFDIYNEYEGINNLKTLNDKAAYAPVTVDGAILELLQDCKDYYKSTDGVFNAAMGSVLEIWHVARTDGLNDPENAYLPNLAELEKARMHINPEDIIIDKENSTVFFADPYLKLDVGGIAKGWAVEHLTKDISGGLLISVGGNVYATGPKDENNTPWGVGIRNPDKEDEFLHILNITHGSVVTSGSYYRAYMVDGKRYHHIIDPNTLYPGEKWTSVSIVCEDSGLSDVLSTSLFLLDLEEGKELLENFDAEAMWVDSEGNKYYSSGFVALIKI